MVLIAWLFFLIDQNKMWHLLEYSMNSLQQSLEKLNDNLNNDFEANKSLYEEATNNHCSDLTRRQLLNKGECDHYELFL